MYAMPTCFSRRMNIKVSLLISILAISMFTVGIPLVTTQIARMATSFAKISPILLNEIMAKEDTFINVLIETYTAAYAPIVADVINLGGEVSYQCRYINALAVTLPADKITTLANNPNIKKIYLDETRALSSISDETSLLESLPPEDFVKGRPIEVSTDSYQTISLTAEQIASIEPNTYWNPIAMDAVGVWEKGILGQGSTAAIIDTGIYSKHFMLRGSVIGGIDLSPDEGTRFEGYDKITNHWHGSHVAGIFAGHGAIKVPADSLLAKSIELYTGITLPTDRSGKNKIIPLFGIAPAADIYAIKVFPHTGAGVPEWRIIAAIEHAIELKTSGVLDVDVISMSLGGPTLFDGRDLEDLTVGIATSVGITVVSAAGNEGPALMSVSSPGSANTGITVGAAAHPVNTRVFWDYYYGMLGIGYYLYTSDDPQIQALSSRGPTSDGRGKPDVAATGIFVLSAYPVKGDPNGLAFASGTSMSTPAVSGAVALLNSYAEAIIPQATPEDYKQAIENGAVWLDGYTTEDQGAGYLNAFGALSDLIDQQEEDKLGDVAESLPPEYDLFDITNIPIVGSGDYSASIVDLAPGHKVDFVFNITEATDSITLDVTDVYLGEENPLGINSFEVYIQSAKRTYYDYYIDSANVEGDASFYITDDETSWSGATYGVYSLSHVIEPGYMKIVVENDWTSYDELSCEIKITVTSAVPTPDFSDSGTIDQDKMLVYGFHGLPSGITTVTLELWWENNWAKYPTSDLDLYIWWYDGTDFHFAGYAAATLNSPERITISDPSMIGLWIQIHGYAIYTSPGPNGETGGTESWTLRIFHG